MKKLKKGDRFLNHLGEYCIIKSIYKGVIKLQICGDEARTEPWKIDDFQYHMSLRFWKVPFPKTNRTNVAQHLLEYQLNIIGKTTADTKKHPNWFNEWKISDTDHQLLKQYALKTLKKIFKFNTSKAKETFEWWRLHFGLHIKLDKRK